MRTCLFAIGLMAVVCCASPGAEPSGTNLAARAVVAPPAREHFHIYLLMGQSNMAGRDTRALASQVDNPRVLALDEQGRWEVAHDPIFPQRGRIQPGAGPGIPFALKMLAADTNLTIGLVPCAVGGTPLRRWVKGGDLYERALTLARSAAQSGVIRGVLWHQGESDSDQEENAKTYEARLTQMFKDLRADLDQPHLPIVVGQLGAFLSPKEHPYAPVVRAALRHVPTVLDDLGYADSVGLGDKGDHLHFSAAAAKVLGERYAAAMRHLLDDQSQLASAVAVVEVWPAGRMPGRGAGEPEAFSSPEKNDARRITNVSHPTLTVFPGPRPHSPTLIVCPGGAYTRHNPVPKIVLIPGLREAVAKQDAVRDLAFLDAPQTICGVPVLPMTLQHVLLLEGVGCPFVTNAPATRESVLRFLWAVSPDYRPDNRAYYRFARRLRKLDFTKAAGECREYVRVALMDAPPRTVTARNRSGSGIAHYSVAAGVVTLIASEFHWSEADILGCPAARLFQYLKCIRHQRNPDEPMFNPSDAVIDDFMSSRAQAKAE